MMKAPPQRKNRPRGFSLVEVTLALGIVAFALVPLLALVPIGLTAAQATIRETAQSHILRQISGDLGMMPFDEIDSYIAAKHQFDSDGRLTDKSTEIIYEAKLERKNATFPGSADIPNVSTHLQQVIVTIGIAANPKAPTTRTTLSLSNTGL